LRYVKTSGFGAGPLQAEAGRDQKQARFTSSLEHHAVLAAKRLAQGVKRPVVELAMSPGLGGIRIPQRQHAELGDDRLLAFTVKGTCPSLFERGHVCEYRDHAIDLAVAVVVGVQ